MAYRITEVQTAPFPSSDACDAALGAAGLSINDMVSVIGSFVCPDENRPGAGYQMALSRQLERYLQGKLEKEGITTPTGRQYSPGLNETADVALEVSKTGKRIYVEIEFRPNVEKDLVKFQIGWNTGRLLIGILILALDRNAVNAGYTSMPEFKKFTRVITELKPSYPLLLAGIRGAHSHSPAV